MFETIVGFIGQGMVGKNMADDFVERGYRVVRYSLEPEYLDNRQKIKDCDVVFIAVPTPTTTAGFDDSTLRKEIKLVGQGKLAVIKSTVLPGTTESIQKENPEIFVLHSPEFLVAARAGQDTRRPERNLVGIPKETNEYKKKAEFTLSLLPRAPYERILPAGETELIKYIGNNFLYGKVVFMNVMYELAQKIGADWSRVSEAVAKDGRIGASHMDPLHASHNDLTKPGRGAGGRCFIKDYEAFLKFYEQQTDDPKGTAFLRALRDKNNELLRQSGKDIDLLEEIYGPT